MITLKEIIDTIDKSNKKLESDVDWENLGNLFEIYSLWSYDDRLKAYNNSVWLCTDTHVGLTTYFLDDIPVCVSSQLYRKHTPDFYFLSKEASEKVYEYLLSLDGREERFYLDYLSLDDTFEDQYTVEFSSNIIHKHAYYMGDKVEILKTYDDYTNFYDVIIKYNGEEKVVQCSELKFNYNEI